MHTSSLTWTWDDRRIELGFDTGGTGPAVLMLPALSSISTRHEMAPLASRLRERFRTIAIDWPGFGDRPRPPLDWTPDAYAAFLAFVLETATPAPHAVVAAGHAAGYGLAHAGAYPGSVTRLVLVSPTWRGPLPTMMNGRRPAFARLARAADPPVIGPLIYGLNVNRFVVRMMANGHVYSDPRWLTKERMDGKLAVTRARGARFASTRFVTGMLDPLPTRESFLDLARRAGVPILVVYGAQSTRKSLAEMDALAALPGVRSARLTAGKLGVHEEYPDATADAIMPFLSVDINAAGQRT